MQTGLSHLAHPFCLFVQLPFQFHLDGFPAAPPTGYENSAGGERTNLWFLVWVTCKGSVLQWEAVPAEGLSPANCPVLRGTRGLEGASRGQTTRKGWDGRQRRGQAGALSKEEGLPGRGWGRVTRRMFAAEKRGATVRQGRPA